MAVARTNVLDALRVVLISTSLCVLMQLATPVHAQVYKCKLPNGRTVIQDTECAKDEDYSTGQGVAIKPKASKPAPADESKAQKTIEEQMEERASAEAANKAHEAARPKGADEPYVSPYAAKEKSSKNCVGCGDGGSELAVLTNASTGILLTAVLISLAICAFVGFVASRFNRSFLLWFLLAFFFSPLVIIILLIMGRRQA
jgi:hypothetical protein